MICHRPSRTGADIREAAEAMHGLPLAIRPVDGDTSRHDGRIAIDAHFGPI